MAPRSTIELHPLRVEIERALVSGEPLRAIAGRFGVSRAALGRHKRTLIQSLALVEARKASARLHERAALGALSLDLQGFALSALNAAHERGDEVAAAAWFDRAVKAGGFRLQVETARNLRSPEDAGSEVIMRIGKQKDMARVAESFLEEIARVRAEREAVSAMTIEHAPPTDDS